MIHKFMDNLHKCDKVILALILVLLGFGLLFIYSTSFSVAISKHGGSSTFFVVKQASRAVIGIVGFLLFLNLDYKKMSVFSIGAVFITIGMLIWVLVFGRSFNGAKRWIDLGFMTMQVSEMARLVFVVFFARFLAKMSIKDMRNYKNLLFPGGIFVIMAGLIAAGPDFSSAAVFTMIALSMLVIAGLRFKFISAIVLVVVVAGALYVGSSGYRMRRVTSFLNKKESAQGAGFQASQAMLGIGNGGLFGTGLGHGKQKEFFVPEPHTDYVFSTVSEEIGFVWNLLLIGAFVTLILRSIQIARYAPDREGQILAFGLTMLVAINFFIHTGVNVGFFPSTGIPLPFISFGGMSLVFTLSAMGILLNISAHTTIPSRGKK